MKTITQRQFASVKRIAQNVSPLVIKRNKIIEKIKKLDEESNELLKEIEGHEGGVISLTDGYTSSYIVKRVVTATDKVDGDGNVIKKTEYVPTDNVTFNEETKLYEIKGPSDNINIELPYESEYGSDFDADTEKLECNNN